MLTNKHHFTIFPAVHIRSGKVVRFKGGDSSNSIVFSSDPVACAQNWIDQGATWLQLVNLDAVFDEGTANNWELIKKICQLNVNIQLAGGIRTMEDVDWALNSGINRVIIGSAAVDNPQFMADAIAKYGADKVIVAIDSDESGKVRTHGWRGVSAIESIGFGVQMRQLGVTTAVYTNIHRDGSMTGVDWQSAADLSKFTGLQIIAGGGVKDYDDIIASYHQDGIAGVIIGSALYTGKINLEKALKAAKLKLSFDSDLSKWKASQETPWGKLRYKLVAHNLKQFLPTDRPLKILDVGGGNGREAISFAQLGHHVTIFDSSQAMLADAGVYADEYQVADKMSYALADVDVLSQHFDKESFDVILCHEVLQYIDDIETHLQDITALLKPSGILSLMSLNQYSLPLHALFLQNSINDAIGMLNERQHPSDTFDSMDGYYTADEISDILTQNDLELKGHFGIRCLYDYWGSDQQKSDGKTAAELEKLEMALMDRFPYKNMARYFQLIGQKQG